MYKTEVCITHLLHKLLHLCFRIKTDDDFRSLRDFNVNFELLWRDTRCVGEIGIVEMVNMWEIEGPVDVFIGNSYTKGKFLVD